MSQLDRLCEKFRIKCESVYKRRRLTVPFFCGPAIEREPTAADVLSCLCTDIRVSEQPFEDFCDDFGFDRDSRKAERVYLACKKLAPRVRKLLGDAFDDVAGAEH